MMLITEGNQNQSPSSCIPMTLFRATNFWVVRLPPRANAVPVRLLAPPGETGAASRAPATSTNHAQLMPHQSRALPCPEPRSLPGTPLPARRRNAAKASSIWAPADGLSSPQSPTREISKRSPLRRRRQHHRLLLALSSPGL
jgi:hypothetical protein